MTDDVHTPTNAGPDPEPSGPTAAPPVLGPEPESAERPEILIGAAFAGGLAAAMILKRVLRD